MSSSFPRPQWNETFLDLFQQCETKYRAGETNLEHYFTSEDLTFLGSIGYKPREFFDYVEDFVDSNTPTPTDALLIAAVRREYFYFEQQGVASTKEMKPTELPPKSAELAGYTWLPRILQKAENKLRGENDPDIMYSCGGDRRFLVQHNLHPADFLRIVWKANGNYEQILDILQ